ncbi:MAG: diguanylate cyclase [Sulfurimonas sp.]
MREKQKTKLLLLSLLFIAIAIVGYFIIDAMQKAKKEYYLNVQSNLLKVKYDTSYRYFKIMTKDVYEMYSSNQKLMNLFARALNADTQKQALIRDKMYKSLYENYKRLNNMGISQVHFYLPNNISFLRMYKAEKFGDDVSSLKKSVYLTNKTLKMHDGFEACNFMIGLRFVYPLYDLKHKHIGSLEVSYSTQELLRGITDEFVYDSHVLVSKAIGHGNVIEDELGSSYKDSWEAEKYYVEESTHKSIGDLNLYEKINTKVLREKIAQGIQSKKPFAVAVSYNYQNIILSFLPMSSAFTIDNVAYVVTYTESDYLSNITLQTNYIFSLFYTMLSILYLFALYVVNSQSKLRKLALYDNLTKLPNRSLFMIEFNNELNRAVRYDTKIALLFLDLDDFKAVNDTYGHQAGDIVLKKVADRITSRIRNSDSVSRLGGDEFTIILNDIQNSVKAVDIAHEIIEEINKEIVFKNEVLHVGASVGIAIYPEHSKVMETLIKYADDMMYKSKKSGTNKVELYNIEENRDV